MNQRNLVKRIKELLRKKPLAKDTITTTIWSAIGRAIGFFITIVIAAYFGVTSQTDAFFFAYGIIIFASSIFATALEVTVVPYISDMRVNNKDVGNFIFMILMQSSIIVVGIMGLMIIVMKPLLSLITHFDSTSLDLIFILLIETSPIILLITWNSILKGALNTYKKFVIPALSPGFSAIIVIAVIFLFKESWGIKSISRGYVLGQFFETIILFIAIYKFNLFHLRFSIKFYSKLKEFFKNTSYQVLGMIAVGLNPIIDKTMASWLVGDGSVSILHYAEKLYFVPVTLITSGLMVTILSYWSKRYYDSGNLKRLNSDVKRMIKKIVIIFVPVLLFLILINKQIVNLAFGRGAFDLEKISEVGLVWICYLLGFIPYIIGRIYIRAHLIIKNMRIFLVFGVTNCVLNISFNAILMKFIGIAGIALSTSLTNIIIAMLVWVNLNKKLRQL